MGYYHKMSFFCQIYEPVRIKINGSHQEQFGMLSNVLRLCSLFRRNNANAKLNQILTNANFLVGGSNNGSITSKPNTIPNTPPGINNMRGMGTHGSYLLL